MRLQWIMTVISLEARHRILMPRQMPRQYSQRRHLQKVLFFLTGCATIDINLA